MEDTIEEIENTDESCLTGIYGNDCTRDYLSYPTLNKLSSIDKITEEHEKKSVITGLTPFLDDQENTELSQSNAAHERALQIVKGLLVADAIIRFVCCMFLLGSDPACTEIMIILLSAVFAICTCPYGFILCRDIVRNQKAVISIILLGLCCTVFVWILGCYIVSIWNTTRGSALPGVLSLIPGMFSLICMPWNFRFFFR